MYFYNKNNLQMDGLNDNLDKQWRHAWFDCMKYTIPEKMHSIARNPNLTMNIIIATNSTYNWDYNGISENPNLCEEFVLKNLNESWNWREISRNPSIKFGKLLKKYGYTAFVSLNPSVTIDVVLQNPNYKWYWNYLCYNPSMNLDTFRKYPTKPWSLGCFAQNPNITLKDILDNPEIEWDWYYASKNEKVTIEIIQQYFNKWNWYGLSKNPSVTLQMIDDNPNYPWCFHDVCCNPNTTIDFYLKHKNIRDIRGIHNLNDILCNPNILICDIVFAVENGQIDFKHGLYCLVDKTFEKDKVMFMQQHTKNAILITINRYLHQPAICKQLIHPKPIESVIFDEYLLKMICEY